MLGLQTPMLAANTETTNINRTCVSLISASPLCTALHKTFVGRIEDVHSAETKMSYIWRGVPACGRLEYPDFMMEYLAVMATVMSCNGARRALRQRSGT